MTFRLQYAAISDVGRVRKDNQDSGYAGPWVLTVCDGVGGAARGDIASSTAVQQLRRLDQKPTDDLLGQVAGALHRAHDRIGELVDEDPALNGTSTTATVALFDGARLGMGHVGDSRAYLLRDNAITQLTKDHTFVQTLIDEGRITEDEARVHPHRNLILKAIDGIHEAEPDLFHVRAPGRRPDPAVQRRRQRRARRRPPRRHPHAPAPPTTPPSSWSAPASRPAAPTTSPASWPTCVEADVTEAATQEPMLVGAAADLPPQARRHGRPLPRPPLRRHRRARAGQRRDPRRRTVRDPDRPDRPGGGALRPATAATASCGSSGLLAVAIVVGLVWIGLAAAWSWSQQQYYVGEDGGVVTIYRGLNADLPGIELSSPYETTNVEVDRLSDFDADNVREGIDAGNLDDARHTVDNLAERQSTVRGRPTRGRADMAQNSTLMGFVHRRRRGAELFLLVLALAVGIGAYAAVGLGVEGEVPADILAYGGWLAGARHRRAHRGPDHRAVRRPGPAARRRGAQRPRPGRDPPARPRVRGRGGQARLRAAAADLDDPRRAPVRRHPGRSSATTGSLQRFTYTSA